ncbi:MAG: tRNA (adenosine(37)-N6)-threonylcarbamoyltransferase complex ATPase subunit type 1 TsaE [Anditalea sp.]
MKKIFCENQDQIPATAEKIIEFCKEESIWVFTGRMGAGKTTLIKAIAKKMGVVDLVSSPSFSIINEYNNAQGQVFYHFDFYRVNHPDEALDLGVEEYFYSGNYCWIEWAEKISAYIPEKFALVTIEAGKNDKREIALKIIEDGGS